MTNEFLSKQMQPRKLNVAYVNITAGGSNKVVIAAPGAGSRLRVYGVLVSQDGTALDVASFHFSGGTKVGTVRVLSGGAPVELPIRGGYVEGEDNESLQVDVTDQASDDWDITVYYTKEDN